jgi:hypothetical protein
MNKKNIVVGGSGHNSFLEVVKRWINNSYHANKIEKLNIQDQLQTEIIMILTECYNYNKDKAIKLIKDKPIRELDEIKALLLRGNDNEITNIQDVFNEISIIDDKTNKNKKQSWKKNRFYE